MLGSFANLSMAGLKSTGDTKVLRQYPRLRSSPDCVLEGETDDTHRAELCLVLNAISRLSLRIACFVSLTYSSHNDVM